MEEARLELDKDVNANPEFLSNTPFADLDELAEHLFV
jgi:hypothetical protein